MLLRKTQFKFIIGPTTATEVDFVIDQSAGLFT